MAMTKKLFLLRHAEKASNAYEKDISLSEKGFEQALVMGQYLNALGHHPDHILCSTALRTQQTLEKLLEGLNQNKEASISFEEQLYSGSVGDILTLCQQTSEERNSLLIVGHNPLIPQFLTLLATRDSYLDQQHATFRGQYHPCTFSILTVPAKRWAEIQPAENILEKMIYTKDIAPHL